MKQLVTVCMVLIMAGTACKKDGSSDLPVREIMNVTYGPNERHVMDVYLPAGRTTSNTPALVLIHGGAWVSGDKSEMNGTIAALRQALPEYAFFNINYRLATTGGNLWPTQIDDVNMAMDVIRNRADEYRFNKNLMAIGGASAGAHLSLLHAYKHNAGGHIKAAISLFGPTEMKDLYHFSTPNTQFLLSLFMGGTPSNNPTAYFNASPLYAVNSSSAPTIILHGTADNVVPIAQSDSLNNRLINANVARQYVVYNGEGHGVWSASNTADAHAKAAAFLKAHVK